MPSLYLTQQNTVLRKTSECLLFCRKPRPTRRGRPPIREDILLRIPCADVDQVMLFGNIQVTTQALQELLTHRIELAIFTLSGRLLGQLTPPKTKNIPLRIEQFKRYADASFSLMLSKAIVTEKIKTALELAREYRKNAPDKIDPGKFTQLQRLYEKIDSTEELAVLRGVEGAAAAAWFSIFGDLLNPQFRFEQRNRQPPKDPVNAALSFGYVILGAEIQSLLDGVGFDPFLGYYHQPTYGAPALALDLLELYRHRVIDRLVLRLFNLRKLNETHFTAPATGGVYLNGAGKRIFFTAYEKIMGSYRGSSSPAGQPEGIRLLLQTQAQKLQNTIQTGEQLKIVV